MGGSRVAIVRGGSLNPFEMQSYEPLASRYDLTGYAGFKNGYELDRIRFPVRRLHMPEEYVGGLPWPLGSLAYIAMLPAGWNYRMFGLEKELADKDILHAAETYNGYSYQCARVRRGTGKKMVLTVWENIPFQSLRAFRGVASNERIYEFIKENTDVFIAVTGRARKALQVEGVPEEKIRTVPVGIDVARFKPARDPAMREELGIADGEFALLFVGRLTPEKGVYDLLHAMKLMALDRGMDGVRVVLAGAGPEREGIVRRARKLGVEGRLRLAGNFSYGAMPRLYNAADAFVLPSIPVHFWQEQFGMVLLEAMASGLPVVATASGSIPEVVGDAGILVQPGDPVSIAGAVERLAGDAALRGALGARARSRAESEFDTAKVAGQIEAVYRELG